MPAKNRIKIYVEDGHYHVYNRGVNKHNIFLDDQDYRVFLNIIKALLLPNSVDARHPLIESGFKITRLRELKSLHGEIELLAYCLMPNHFHLLIHQNTKLGMQTLMRRLCTAYSMYVNKKYERVGHLFQGSYKAALINDDAYLLHTSRYIHLNPLGMTGIVPVSNYPYSSYVYYLGHMKAEWLSPQPILSYFKTAQREGLSDFTSYQSFAEDYPQDAGEILGNLTLE